MKNEFKYCLVQLLTYEVDTRKRKQFISCDDCPIKSRCRKTMEYKENENDD